jgi:hypothetical protein
MPDEDTDITKILVGIGRLEVKADATNEHLARLNGSVHTLYGRADANKESIAELKNELLEHQIECPGLKTITEINRKLDSGDFHGSVEVRKRLDAAEKDAAEPSIDWKNGLLLPAIRWALMAIGMLILIHTYELVKGIK